MISIHGLKDERDRIKVALVTGDTEISTKINYIKKDLLLRPIMVLKR
ncbi:MAG: hypothetical protein Q9N34_04240 [Aquificota bacterium]|nr:hypothetical protein [Aquificota bacterium]